MTATSLHADPARVTARSHTFVKESRVAAPASALFAFHESPRAFARLTPPWEPVRVISRDAAGIRDGARLVMELRVGPVRQRWVALHRDYMPGVQFVDVQESGPFARWEHTHRVREAGDGGSILEDRIEYVLPFGPLGGLGAAFAKSKLERMFRYRHEVTVTDVETHQRTPLAPSRVAISGATGMVGSSLAAFLAGGGHTPLPLVRRKTGAEGEILWNPKSGEVDLAALEGVDAVVHLAGESVASGRWTDERKASIRSSRVDGTRAIVEALAALKKKPKVLVCASAIGYYGDTHDTWVDESSPRGGGFLAEVCEAWEHEARAAEDAGIRVVMLRIGIVQSLAGGALQKLVTPFKLGAGGPIGNGKQWTSWIELDDLVRAIHFAIATDTLRGPVNAVAPQPVTNAEYATTLGRVLHRPAIIPLPAFAIRAGFGQMGTEALLAGQRVRPRELASHGFEWRYPELEGALRHVLGA